MTCACNTWRRWLLTAVLVALSVLFAGAMTACSKGQNNANGAAASGTIISVRNLAGTNVVGLDTLFDAPSSSIVIAALQSGTILAAGLDVFAAEPNVPDELKSMQNVVLLPHIGSASVVTRNAMDQLVVDNLKNWFSGRPPLTPVPETPVEAR